jgi:hypothetical protein
MRPSVGVPVGRVGWLSLCNTAEASIAALRFPIAVVTMCMRLAPVGCVQTVVQTLCAERWINSNSCVVLCRRHSCSIVEPVRNLVLGKVRGQKQ